MGFFDNDEGDETTSDNGGLLDSFSSAAGKAWDIATAPAVAAGEAVMDASRAVADAVYGDDGNGNSHLNTPFVTARTTSDGTTEQRDFVVPGLAVRGHGEATSTTAHGTVSVGPVDLVDVETSTRSDGTEDHTVTILPQVGRAAAWVEDAVEHNHIRFGSDIGEAAAGSGADIARAAGAVGEAFTAVNEAVGEAEWSAVGAVADAVDAFGHAIAPNADWENDPIDAVRSVADTIRDSMDVPTADLHDGRLELELPFLGHETQISVGADGAELHVDVLGAGVDAVTTFGQSSYVGVHDGDSESGVEFDLTDGPHIEASDLLAEAPVSFEPADDDPTFD